jgi:hypothetical protein
MNNAKITRFEAFTLYKSYDAKSDLHRQDGKLYLAQIYLDKAQEWLDKACEIESTNSDQVNEQMPSDVLISITD